jgi:hypothetical protein
MCVLFCWKGEKEPQQFISCSFVPSTALLCRAILLLLLCYTRFPLLYFVAADAECQRGLGCVCVYVCYINIINEIESVCALVKRENKKEMKWKKKKKIEAPCRPCCCTHRIGERKEGRQQHQFATEQ